MANHEIVPASAFTKGTAERRKSATSFSLPGFACSGTYSANLVIVFSCVDRVTSHEEPEERWRSSWFRRRHDEARESCPLQQCLHLRPWIGREVLEWGPVPI